jgi:copper chaperone
MQTTAAPLITLVLRLETNVWSMTNGGHFRGIAKGTTMTTGTIEHVTFIAPDITCGHCVAKVQDAIRKLDGVKSGHASAETRFVDVDFDPEIVTAEQVAAALAQAGYPVRG